jgi:hypothetical protein
MQRLTLVLLIGLSLGQLPSAPPIGPETIDVVGNRAMKSIAAADWNAFRQDAAPGVCVEEYWRGYDQYFGKDYLSKPKRPTFGDRYVANIQWLNTGSALDAEGKMVFHRMQEMFKSRRSATSPSPASSSKGFESWGGEASGLNGPHIGDTVASNLDCHLEMENSTGRWRVFRIVVAMH